MKRSPEVKDRIINATIALIAQSGGDVKDITARQIAEKAHIGLGLINYHFGSKENLITVCVQYVIKDVIAGFDTTREFVSDKERITAWAIHVFEFLFENAAISKISILGDMQKYSAECNAAKSQRGFMLAMTSDMDESDKQLMAFILVSAMQTAFLSRDCAEDLLGYDFNKKAGRAAYVKKLVDKIFVDDRKVD